MRDDGPPHPPGEETRRSAHLPSLTTPLCRRLGVEVPVFQAPIGSAVSPELVAGVSHAGGLGMLALTWTPAGEIPRILDRVRELTERPFGANLVLDFPVADRLDACLEGGVPVISTFWGDPAGCTDRIRAAGAFHVHTVGSADEARHAADAGVDAVVAQGWEAGGHVRGLTATLPLVPAVVDAVSPLPVVAAGGIADGRGLAAALALGAQAGWMGTRFLAATEARTHDIYRAASSAHEPKKPSTPAASTAAGRTRRTGPCATAHWPPGKRPAPRSRPGRVRETSLPGEPTTPRTCATRTPYRWPA
ncbi:nitronate monooxygenase [Streptomyces angustmyceticus]|uniref:nitronate monooxygenase n=1 Tax=Streptomyces angustmyceticus TaxID=285578 RepID=UPI0021B0637C|nr:nitronate monooxygenase [Streptomyces angustmyceticus]